VRSCEHAYRSDVLMSSGSVPVPVITAKGLKAMITVMCATMETEDSRTGVGERVVRDVARGTFDCQTLLQLLYPSAHAGVVLKYVLARACIAFLCYGAHSCEHCKRGIGGAAISLRTLDQASEDRISRNNRVYMCVRPALSHSKGLIDILLCKVCLQTLSANMVRLLAQNEIIGGLEAYNAC
jgi:hypothetical protein